VRLRGEIVDLVRLDLGQDGGQRFGVAEITVVKTKMTFTDRIPAQVVDAFAVEGRRPPYHAMDLVVLLEEKLREVGAVLAGNAGYQCLFHRMESIRQASSRVSLDESGATFTIVTDALEIARRR
jgi:hypothetical protein